MNSLMSPEFSRLMDRWSKKEPENAAEKDVQECIRLILALARKYVRNGVEYEDLVQQAIFRVLSARDKYDKEKSGSFITYAYTCIMREMHTYRRKNSNVLYVPSHVEKAVPSLEGILKALSSTYDNSFTSSDNLKIALTYETDIEHELPNYILSRIRVFKNRILSIAENSKVPYETMASAAYAALTSSSSSQDAGPQDNGSVSGESVEEVVGVVEIQDLLKESLGIKRYLALKLHYDGYTNQDISEILHECGYSGPSGKPITRSAIRSIIENAVSTIKRMEIFQ